MNKNALIKYLLPASYQKNSQNLGRSFAPSNIALCKYWGKRNVDLNLPMTSSLSISLGSKGADCSIKEAEQEKVIVNHTPLPLDHEFSKKLSAYLDLFRPKPHIRYDVNFQFNIPVAAGLASSACCFASLVMALNHLYQWSLNHTSLSVLARLGSGSACRSLWHGFVKWQQGVLDNGLDSHGYLLPQQWKNLCVGLLILSQTKKTISSRDAMLRTANTSVFYKEWPKQVGQDLKQIETAIHCQDFEQLGLTVEANALALHGLMMSAFPPILYSQADTIDTMHRIMDLRKKGYGIYFTQDAGANLKLLFLDKEEVVVASNFPTIDIIKPFEEAHLSLI